MPDSTEKHAAGTSASSAKVALATIGGTLTSRPKTLIHVTLGRLLGQPDGMSSEQDEAFAARVRHFNREKFPQLVASSEQRRFELTAVSLVRDSVWLYVPRARGTHERDDKWE